MGRMTIGELIEELSKFPHDAKVVIAELDGYAVKHRDRYERYDDDPDPYLRADQVVQLNT